MRERKEWIDMLRGFCMMAILYFHTEVYYAEADVTPYALYVDNVLSVFYFISGYLLYSDKGVDVKYKIWRIFRTLFVPYLAFTLLFLPMKAWAHGQWFQLSDMLTEVLLGEASWFVTALIVSELLLVGLLGSMRRHIALWVACYGGLCFCAAMVWGNELSPLYNEYNFWHVNEAMLASFFLSVGYLAHAIPCPWPALRRVWWMPVLLLAAVLLAKSIILMQGADVLFGPVRISSPLLFVADNLLVIALLVTLFHRLPAWRLLSWVGRHSLVYYFVCGGFPLSVSMLFSRYLFAYSSYLSILPVYVLVCLCSTAFVALVYKYLPWVIGQNFKERNSANRGG